MLEFTVSQDGLGALFAGGLSFPIAEDESSCRRDTVEFGDKEPSRAASTILLTRSMCGVSDIEDCAGRCVEGEKLLAALAVKVKTF
jgi:hypothetical protein